MIRHHCWRQHTHESQNTKNQADTHLEDFSLLPCFYNARKDIKVANGEKSSTILINYEISKLQEWQDMPTGIIVE